MNYHLVSNFTTKHNEQWQIKADEFGRLWIWTTPDVEWTRIEICPCINLPGQYYVAQFTLDDDERKRINKIAKQYFEKSNET